MGVSVVRSSPDVCPYFQRLMKFVRDRGTGRRAAGGGATGACANFTAGVANSHGAFTLIRAKVRSARSHMAANSGGIEILPRRLS
jgi:hypothetical protein